MEYDVIIAGGSFAGLAVAAQLRGRRVLLVEPHPIGAVQTSACGTLLAVLEATHTMDSLLQIHDHFVLHLGNRQVTYALPYPFCTFDYPTFCCRLLNQGDAEILQASVLGHSGRQVHTTRGDFEARILIDATGWRASLATQSERKNEPHRGKSFGIETDIPVSENGLHFYYDPKVYQQFNVGWLFPTGVKSRAGLASYQGHTCLNDEFDHFLSKQFGYPSNRRHGGYFPYASQPAITGNIFRVGDAAGQCIPFTGEGIRPALYFGATLGHLAGRVLAGEITEIEAQREYRHFVEIHRGVYRVFWAAQKLLPRLPMLWMQVIAGQIQTSGWINPILQQYWQVIDPSMLMRLRKSDRDRPEQLSRADPRSLVPIRNTKRNAEP